MSSMASNTSNLSPLESAAPMILSSDRPDIHGFYASEELRDCKLVLSGGIVLPCHRVILAGAAPVFKDFFSRTDTATVDLQTADPEAMQLLIQYMYGRDVSIPMSSIVAFYLLARDYEVTKAVELLQNRIRYSITDPHVLAMLLHKAYNAGTAARGITMRLTRAAAFLLPSVMQQDEFKQFPLQLLLAILPSARAAFQRVASAVAAAVWVAAEPGSRMQHWEADLLPVLELETLLADEVKQIKDQHSNLFDLPGVGKALVTACLVQLIPAPTAEAPEGRPVKLRRTTAAFPATMLRTRMGQQPA